MKTETGREKTGRGWWRRNWSPAAASQGWPVIPRSQERAQLLISDLSFLELCKNNFLLSFWSFVTEALGHSYKFISFSLVGYFYMYLSLCLKPNLNSKLYCNLPKCGAHKFCFLSFSSLWIPFYHTTWLGTMSNAGIQRLCCLTEPHTTNGVKKNEHMVEWQTNANILS